MRWFKITFTIPSNAGVFIFQSSYEGTQQAILFYNPSAGMYGFLVQKNSSIEYYKDDSNNLYLYLPAFAPTTLTFSGCHGLKIENTSEPSNKTKLT